MIWKQKLLLLLLCLVLWIPVAEGRKFDSNIQVKDTKKSLAWDYLYTKHQFLLTCDKTTPLTSLPPPVIFPGAPWYVLAYVALYYGLTYFALFLGSYRLWGYLVNTLMVGIPVGSSLVGLHPSALLHYLGSFLPQEWIPDTLVAQIVFHVNMGNQTQKDKQLPPHATATYQPIQPMTDK
ncbi:hypothetical protein DSO57_1024764 [Entomophthora muscae]|uniref:Uncharacterized protein n=1 Tax=Entomophthora muscae TaxID=34485 RepID=A0ACC2RTG8_9FUNG|nr:hypothetical protein DSO57_1024764 [Entomophthora muscae]